MSSGLEVQSRTLPGGKGALPDVTWLCCDWLCVMALHEVRDLAVGGGQRFFVG